MKLASTAEPARVLHDLALSRSTGALHVGSNPPGLLHLVGGRVTHAASPLAPGVGELLTVGGRLPIEVWQSAVDAGSADHRVGEVLVEQGHLTRGELELCVLGVIHDAAFFVLEPRAVPVRFEVDRPHWLGAVAAVPAETVTAEVDRRRATLTAVLDRPALDGAPVHPARRVHRDRVRLSALQWEIVVHADGLLTPSALARHLGRGAYACLLEVRRLAADGLIDLDAPPPAGAEPTQEITELAGPVEAPTAGHPPAPLSADEPQAPRFRLPRRKPARPRDDDGPVPPADEALLHRLRTALRSMT